MGYSAEKPVDVICQHKRDGSIIPIKVRFEDEDGVSQEYKIKAYKEKPDNAISSSTVFPFECKVDSFGVLQKIRLTYYAYEHIWKMIY